MYTHIPSFVDILPIYVPRALSTVPELYSRLSLLIYCIYSSCLYVNLNLLIQPTPPPSPLGIYVCSLCRETCSINYSFALL